MEMRRPSVDDMIKNRTTRYSLVCAVAKRAREISSEAQENGDILNEKPVSIALDEIINGKFEVVESEELQNF